MSFFLSFKQWSKWGLPYKINAWAAIASLAGMLLSILSMQLLFFQPQPSTSIEKKIHELDNIKVALSTLSTYVDKQQTSLKAISTKKIELEKERERIQKILKLDKESLDAFLQYQLAQRKSHAWMEILISFFVGVLSSSVVTFTAIALQKRLRSRKSARIKT